MTLTDKNQEIVSKFHALRKEVDPLVRVSSGGKKYLENYLAFMYGPIFNYTESIVILCNNGKYSAAHVLIRCLFEAHINLIYHQVGDSKKKLAMSARKQQASQVVITEGLKSVLKKYPNLATGNDHELLNISYLDSRLNPAKERMDVIVRANNLTDDDKEKILEQKALECDKHSVVGAEPGHFQLMYEMVYRYLSPYVHLDLQGVEYFYEKSENGDFVFREDNSEDLLIGQSVGISVALVKDLYDNKVITTPRPNVLNDLEDTLSKSAN